ncbi:DnaD domain protein [Aerococcus vaginalis]
MQYTVLEQQLLERYHELGIRNSECMLLIHLIDFEQHGDNFPSFDKLAKRMGVTEKEITDMLRHMMSEGWIEIVQDRQGDRYGDHFDLTLVQQKLGEIDHQALSSSRQVTSFENQQEIFEMISNEFGRQLSPIEYQEIARWMNEDGYEPSTIKEALKEAVVHQVYNLKYISRILYNWKQRNQKTTSQTQGLSEHSSTARPHFPIKRVLNSNNKN